VNALKSAGIWEDLYHSVWIPQINPVLTGFNANIDRIIPVDTGTMRSFKRNTGPAFDAVFDRLIHSMRYCSADEVFISEPSVYNTLVDIFSKSGTLMIGGQAGIAAVHLRKFGIHSVTCAVPGAGPLTCDMLQGAGVIPLAFGSAAENRSDTIHLIFEYPPHLVPVADGVVPRSNRFIVSPVHPPSTVLIPDDAQDAFFNRTASCQRAFLSGYQYLRTEQEFISAARQLQQIRNTNPLMRTHLECVSFADRFVLTMMLRHTIPHVDSIGLNEYELKLLMNTLRGMDNEPAGSLPLSPVACVRETIALADATGVPRVHLHTFGYYILIIKPGILQPEFSRNALLLAARVTADAAGGNEQILSQDGLSAYSAVRTALGTDQTTGIFGVGDRQVVLVPTFISQNINKTTGLGDILSSTAFVADQF